MFDSPGIREGQIHISNQIIDKEKVENKGIIRGMVEIGQKDMVLREVEEEDTEG